jgi:hypothetical protein
MRLLPEDLFDGEKTSMASQKKKREEPLYQRENASGNRFAQRND